MPSRPDTMASSNGRSSRPIRTRTIRGECTVNRIPEHHDHTCAWHGRLQALDRAGVVHQARKLCDRCAIGVIRNSEYRRAACSSTCILGIIKEVHQFGASLRQHRGMLGERHEQ